MSLRPIICILCLIVLLLMIPTSRQHASETLLTAARPESPAAPPHVSRARTYISPGERHKIRVNDPVLAAQLTTQGARLIADYGTFKTFDVDSKAARTAQQSGAVMSDEDNLILLNSGVIDTSTSPRPQKSHSQRQTESVAGKGMRLVQFSGPIQPQWYEALEATGVRIVSYIPNNAYLVYGNGTALQRVGTFGSSDVKVQWDGEYTAANRIDPAIKSQPSSTTGYQTFTVQMVDDSSENAATLGLIEGARLAPIIKQDRTLGYVNVTVALPREAIDSIALRDDVVSIQPWIAPIKFDERQDQILASNLSADQPAPGDYLLYLASHGFTFSSPSDFAVNVSDSGIDNGTMTPNHFALYTLGDPTNPANSRVIYNRLVGTPHSGGTLAGCDGHGNLNSNIIGGYVPSGGIFAVSPHADAAGFRYGLGVAPFVKLGSSVIFDPTTFTSPAYKELESQAYRDGARISSNSWGSTNFAYTADSQQYDALVRDAQPDTNCSLPNCISAPGNQEYVIVFAVGNLGALGPNHIAAPASGKNVISVGAAEGVQAFGGADGSGIDDTGANSANDIINFSSRGATSDGRAKPDIVAPGTHISGGAPQSAIANPTGSGTGSQLACFNGSNISGGPTPSKFWPLSQQWYAASSGTSQATPAIAGTAAVYRQFFINNGLTPPSPALTKALLLNSARYLTGVSANDTLPSINQGMGEGSLNNFFDVFATPHSLHDEVPAEIFTASGQERVMTGSVGNAAKPFRVTLAWTDPPGPTSGNAYVNNLDLEVTIGGNTYLGNVFSGAFSATGGAADPRNNVESVFLPAGVTGSFTVKVKATNIAGDGVPNSGGPLDQDFALVIYNGIENSAPTINAVGVTRQAGSAQSNSTIATVNDNGGAGGVTVTVNGSSSATVNGVTVSNIVNTAGTVTANVVAACAATTAGFTLTATNGGGATATATLTVTVNANTAPTLVYSSPQNVIFGGSLNATPTTATDSGLITGFGVQSVVPALNTPPTVDGSGTVSISNAQPAGSHVLTIRATDNCGATTDAQFTLNVSALPSIIGQLLYADTVNPGANVNMSLSAPAFTTLTATTDANGNYTFAGLPVGNTYTVTPSKSGGINGLESIDASDVARYASGLALPSANQSIAGDADGDGNLTSFDASLIARYVAGLPDTGIVGTWKFSPASRSYPLLSTDQMNQNFTAILVGDTGQDWAQGLTIANGGLVNGPALPTVLELLQKAATAPVSLSNTPALPGTSISVPITVSHLTGLGVRAYDLQISFDPTVIQPEATPFDKTGTLSAGMAITPNATNAGHLIISGFAASELSGAGTLLNLNFKVVGTPGQATPLTFQDYIDGKNFFHFGFRFNSGTPGPVIANGEIAIVDPKSAGNITGRISDNNGNGVEGVSVRLTGTQNRLIMTDAQGNYRFDNVDTSGSYSVTPARANFDFTPAQRSFAPTGLHTEATFTASANGAGLNPLDTTEYFVRQQYLDFLNREPDESGLNFWVNTIESCGGDAACREVKRINNSGAFFLSIEFQETGYLVYRTYQAAYGEQPGVPVPVQLTEFKPDTQEIGNGVIVLQDGWQQKLENNKQAYMADFVSRPRFTLAYPTTMTPSDFVNQLFARAGVVPSPADLNTAINEFGGAGNSADPAARARALRDVADNAALSAQQFNQAFVLMQYFGYLRRDPNAAPDSDFGGYNFWLGKLNAFNGNYIDAEMVKAFISATEYRGRFRL